MSVFKVKKDMQCIYFNGEIFKCKNGEVEIPDEYDFYFEKYYEKNDKKKTLKQKEEEKDVNGIQ